MNFKGTINDRNHPWSMLSRKVSRLQDWLLAIVGLYRPVSVDLQSVLRGQAQETGSRD
jgi:hypothetical protein